MVKAVLIRCQTEMSSMLGDNGEKVIRVIKWQRMWLDCVLVFVEGRVDSDEVEYLAEDISKQIVEGMSSSSLLIVKCERKEMT